MLSLATRLFISAPLVLAQDLFLAKEPVDPEVIIVGAGWAGMSAARQLALHGVSFKIIEARNYTGGRSHAIQFGSDNVGTFTMEIGSGWLESSGKRGGPEHEIPPVVRFAQEYGLKTAFVPGSTQNMTNYGHIYTPEGIAKDCDHDGSIRKHANKAYSCLNKLAKKGKENDSETLRQALVKCGWEPKTSCERAVDWAVTVDEPGMVPEKQTLSGTLPDEVYKWWGPDDHFVVDQRPRGYAGALDEMVKDIIPPGDARIILNTKVTQVAYDHKGVTVLTEDGKAHKAKVAITTFPLGVLNRHHRDLFKPNVPEEFAEILDDGTFIMSNLTRVYLQFPSVFWDNNDRAFLLAHNGPRGDFTEFRNLNRHGNVPGSNILLSFLGNPDSAKYENMADEDVKAAAVQKLREAFGADKVPDPVAFHMTRWGLDPLAYGCYSTTTPGFRDNKVFSTLKKPLKDRVYMAGEALCDDLSGSTYGAYQSGYQVALTYLHKTKRVSKAPKDLCNW